MQLVDFATRRRVTVVRLIVDSPIIRHWQTERELPSDVRLTKKSEKTPGP